MLVSFTNIVDNSINFIKLKKTNQGNPVTEMP
jgi:hypothetical protein